jgi:hypothetical protein
MTKRPLVRDPEKKLALAKETLRQLGNHELGRVVGGGTVRTGVCDSGAGNCPCSDACHTLVAA